MLSLNVDPSLIEIFPKLTTALASLGPAILAPYSELTPNVTLELLFFLKVIKSVPLLVRPKSNLVEGLVFPFKPTFPEESIRILSVPACLNIVAAPDAPWSINTSALDAVVSV